MQIVCSYMHTFISKLKSGCYSYNWHSTHRSNRSLIGYIVFKPLRCNFHISKIPRFPHWTCFIKYRRHIHTYLKLPVWYKTKDGCQYFGHQFCLEIKLVAKHSSRNYFSISPHYLTSVQCYMKEASRGPSQYKDVALPVYGYPCLRQDGLATVLSLTWEFP